MDTHPIANPNSQWHAVLHHAVWRPQQEVTRPKSRFKPTSPEKSWVSYLFWSSFRLKRFIIEVCQRFFLENKKCVGRKCLKNLFERGHWFHIFAGISISQISRAAFTQLQTFSVKKLFWRAPFGCLYQTILTYFVKGSTLNQVTSCLTCSYSAALIMAK